MLDFVIEYKIQIPNRLQNTNSKVWHGALVLGIECNSIGDKGGVVKGVKNEIEVVCLKEIQENEKRDEVESFRREHKKSVCR
jgi:hypothetical protein